MFMTLNNFDDLLSILSLGCHGADISPAQLLDYLHHGLGLNKRYEELFVMVTETRAHDF